jgi:hypothetical protein
MKKTFLKLTSVLMVAGLSFNAVAQEDIASLFKAGVTDLDYVVESYMKPMGTGFAAGLGSNWYNTAASHKLFGFDITVGGGVAMAPSADKTFSLSGLKNLKALGGQTTAPTFAGSGDGPELSLMQPKNITVGGVTVANPDYNNGNGVITKFSSPAGVLDMIPVVNAQLALGLPFGTEIAVRFVPTINASGFDMGLWGIGVKHDFKQWIPAIKELPFDASVFVGYTKFTLNYKFAAADQITPDQLVDPLVGYIPPVGVSFNDQKLGLTASALTANVLISKKLLFFTPYLGLGITSSSFNLGFKGNYPLINEPYLDPINNPTSPSFDPVATSTNPNPNNGKMQISVMKDPIDMTYDNVMPNLTVGFRLKILWVLALHAQYTLQKYPIASVGFGINIR